MSEHATSEEVQSKENERRRGRGKQGLNRKRGSIFAIYSLSFPSLLMFFRQPFFIIFISFSLATPITPSSAK